MIREGKPGTEKDVALKLRLYTRIFLFTFFLIRWFLLVFSNKGSLEGILKKKEFEKELNWRIELIVEDSLAR